MTFFRALMVLCLLVSPALAQGKQATKQEQIESDARFHEAKIKFKAKKYQEAARLFLIVYSKTNRSDALFNAGRCYEELGQFQEAITVFKEYLTLKDASGDGKEEAQMKIKVLSEELERQKRLSVLPKKQPQPAVTPDPIHQKTTVEITKPKETPIDIVMWGSYGGALVLIGTGTVGIISSVSSAEKLSTMNFATDDASSVYKTNYASIQRNYYIFGATCVVGAGLGAYATWRLLLHKEQTATSWHIVPAFSQSTPMMVLSGNF